MTRKKDAQKKQRAIKRAVKRGAKTVDERDANTEGVDANAAVAPDAKISDNTSSGTPVNHGKAESVDDRKLGANDAAAPPQADLIENRDVLAVAGVDVPEHTTERDPLAMRFDYLKMVSTPVNMTDPVAVRRANIQIDVANTLLMAAEHSCSQTLQLANAIIIEMRTVDAFHFMNKTKIAVNHLNTFIQVVDKYIAADKEHSAKFTSYMDWEFRELRGHFDYNPRVQEIDERLRTMYKAKVTSETTLKTSLEKLKGRSKMRRQAREVVGDLLVRTDNPDSMAKALENALATIKDVNSREKAKDDGTEESSTVGSAFRSAKPDLSAGQSAVEN